MRFAALAGLDSKHSSLRVQVSKGFTVSVFKVLRAEVLSVLRLQGLGPKFRMISFAGV